MFFKYFFLFFFAFFPSRYYCRRYITHNRRGRPYIYSVALLSLQYRLVWRSSRTRGRPEFLFVENKTRGGNLPATRPPPLRIGTGYLIRHLYVRRIVIKRIISVLLLFYIYFFFLIFAPAAAAASRTHVVYDVVHLWSRWIFFFSLPLQPCRTTSQPGMERKKKKKPLLLARTHDKCNFFFFSSFFSRRPTAAVAYYIIIIFVFVLLLLLLLLYIRVRVCDVWAWVRHGRRPDDQRRRRQLFTARVLLAATIIT